MHDSLRSETTLIDCIDRLADHGERPAVLHMQPDGVRRWSYGELSEHVRRVAAGLIHCEARPGQPVAILSASRPEWIACCLAVIRAGAVALPLDVQLDDETLVRIFNENELRWIATTSDQFDRIERLDVEIRPTAILLDAGPDDDRSWRNFDGDASDLPRIEPDDPALWFYTSGTTGPPKGVPLSHRNVSFELHVLREADLVTEDDRALLPLPLHHVYPLVIGMLTPLSLGLPIVFPQSLTGPQIVRAIDAGQVTVVIGVPRLYRALYDGIRSRAEASGAARRKWFEWSLGLSTSLRRRFGMRLGKWLLRPLHKQFGLQLRVLACGGAPLEPDLAWKLEALGWQVGIGYGLTETSPLLTLNPPGRARIGSVGRPVSGVELRIDRADAEQAADEDSPEREAPGEIVARGPNVFAGYLHQPDKTEESFTPDGWFRTGDLGYFDADGWLYVTGRASTLIVTEGGENVQPEEVEDAYAESPAIREVGVLQEDGKLAALIVPDLAQLQQQGRQDVEAAVREAVDERSRTLPSYERLSDYSLTREALPRTRLGKIQRHKLQERYRQARQGAEVEPTSGEPLPIGEMSDQDRALLESPAAKQVWDLLAEKYSSSRLTPDTSLQLDLDVDSLGWLNLSLEIRQRAGIELDEEAIGRIGTVRDLLQETAELSASGEKTPTAAPLEEPEKALTADQAARLEPHGPVLSALSRAMYAANTALMKLLFHLQVEGREHLPVEGPFVLAPNHISYLDPPAIAAALRPSLRRALYWGGWTGAAFRNPVVRAISRLGHVVPIDPQRAVISSLAFGAAVLKRERSLVWFPEGQRSPDGRLQPFKPGIGLLLKHHPVPVIPVFIHGAYDALPAGRALPRLRTIRVRFGEPLDVDQLESRGRGDTPQDKIASALHDHVAALGEASDRPRTAP